MKCILIAAINDIFIEKISMQKVNPVFVAIVAVAVLCGMYYMKNAAYAHGGDVTMGMGGGMMGGSDGANEDTNEAVDSSHADKLLSYIHNQGLSCLNCHSVSSGGFGPSFVSVSVKYAKVNNAESIVSAHIEHGVGRMPPGQANSVQATQLAKLILELTDSKVKN